MRLAMPFVWDERCRAHEPRSELWVGVPTPAAETASRIDAIRSTLVEAHARVVAAVPHAVDALLAVHDPELLAYLEAAWDEWGCQGRDTASFAQDWKTFGFEPAGVAPLVRFYGGTNPTDWLQSERYEDCAAP